MNQMAGFVDDVEKERFKVSSVTPERVNHIIHSSYIYSLGRAVNVCRLVASRVSHIARVLSERAHDSESF